MLPSHRKENLPTGVALYIAAFFFLILLDATSKHLGRHFPIVQLVFVRHAVHCVLMLAVFGPSLGAKLVRTRAPGLQLLRGLLMLVMTFSMMTALTLLPLADAVAIIFLAPLLVTALSRWLLTEQVDVRQWIAVVVGFGGVLLIVRPGAGIEMAGVLLALVMVVCNGFFQIITRRLSAVDDAGATNFLTSLVCSVLVAVPALLSWQPPDAQFALPMLALGALGAAGHYIFIKAFEHAPASVLAPFMYTGLVWSILFGWAIFGDVPDVPGVCGMAVIAACGIYVVRRAHVRASVARGRGR